MPLGPGRQRADRRAGLDVVQPAAQLALLAAGEHHHAPRVGCGALHQRQSLQHRVVQMGGHVVAFLIADRGPAPRRAVAWSGGRCTARPSTAAPANAIASAARAAGSCATRTPRGDQRNDAGERQGNPAERTQRSGSGPAAPARADRLRVRIAAAIPQQRRPAGDDDRRDHDRVARPQTDVARRHQQPAGGRGDGDRSRRHQSRVRPASGPAARPATG